MTKKPPLWADGLLTLWVLVVTVFYFGGYFLPAQIGVYTQVGAGFYALMLLISAGTLAWNYLHRAEANKMKTRKKTKRTQTKDTRTKIRKNPLRCETDVFLSGFPHYWGLGGLLLLLSLARAVTAAPQAVYQADPAWYFTNAPAPMPARACSRTARTTVRWPPSTIWIKQPMAARMSAASR